MNVWTRSGGQIATRANASTVYATGGHTAPDAVRVSKDGQAVAATNAMHAGKVTTVTFARRDLTKTPIVGSVHANTMEKTAISVARVGNLGNIRLHYSPTQSVVMISVIYVTNVFQIIGVIRANSVPGERMFPE